MPGENQDVPRSGARPAALAANSTGTNRPAAEAALLFLFQRRFFR